MAFDEGAGAPLAKRMVQLPLGPRYGLVLPATRARLTFLPLRQGMPAQ